MIDIAFIGMGALSLRSAYVLAERGISRTHKISMYEGKSTPARKILMAGIGGLNLTKDMAIKDFLTGYGEHAEFMEKYINKFSPQDLISWVNHMGISTFMGSGKKIFPTDLKATPFVRAILEYIHGHNIQTHYNHFMVDITKINHETHGQLYKISFRNGSEVIAKTVVIATGGSSYEKLGGNHDVINLLKRKLDINHTEFKPFNVGVRIPWTHDITDTDMAGKHLKSIAIHTNHKKANHKKDNKYIKGDMVITSYGLEGMPIYAVNQDILHDNKIYLDLKADLSEDQISNKIAKISPKNTTSNRLRKGINLKKEAFFLLKEFHTTKLPTDNTDLAHLIKNLPLNHGGLNETNKSISCSGGINLDELTENLESKTHKNLYMGGEMLNWHAITGGYLLTACFAMGNHIANHIRVR